MYRIQAYWPNSAEEPLTQYSPHFASALTTAIALMQRKIYTTISVTTPDSLELVKLWGQPPAPGEDWP